MAYDDDLLHDDETEIGSSGEHDLHLGDDEDDDAAEDEENLHDFGLHLEDENEHS